MASLGTTSSCLKVMNHKYLKDLMFSSCIDTGKRCFFHCCLCFNQGLMILLLHIARPYWCGLPTNDSHEQGPLLGVFQPVRATGCNPCWYSLFVDGPALVGVGGLITQTHQGHNLLLIHMSHTTPTLMSPLGSCHSLNYSQNI